MVLKMFVWNDVLWDWDSGVMVVYAHTVEEARDLLRAELNDWNEEDIAKEPEIYTKPKAVYRYGGG